MELWRIGWQPPRPWGPTDRVTTTVPGRGQGCDRPPPLGLPAPSCSVLIPAGLTAHPRLTAWGTPRGSFWGGAQLFKGLEAKSVLRTNQHMTARFLGPPGWKPGLVLDSFPRIPQPLSADVTYFNSKRLHKSTSFFPIPLLQSKFMSPSCLLGLVRPPPTGLLASSLLSQISSPFQASL